MPQNPKGKLVDSLFQKLGFDTTEVGNNANTFTPETKSTKPKNAIVDSIFKELNLEPDVKDTVITSQGPGLFERMTGTVKDLFSPSQTEQLSKEELKNLNEQFAATQAESKKKQEELRSYNQNEQLPIGAEVANKLPGDVYNFATKPLKEAGQQLNAASEGLNRFNAGMGIDELLGGIGNLGEAPFTAVLGYLNQAVEPFAKGAANTKIGKAIDKFPLSQAIGSFLRQPATTTMQGLKDVTGLEMPGKGALEAGDLLGNLLMFEAATKAAPNFLKSPGKTTPLKVTSAEDAAMLELRDAVLKRKAEKIFPENQPKQPPKLPADITEQIKGEKNEAKNAKTSEIPPVEGKPAVEKPKGQIKEGTPQPSSGNKTQGKQAEVTPEKPSLTKKQMFSVKTKTLGITGEGTTVNSPKLGKYANDKLPTVEVLKRLKKYGMVDTAVKMAKDLSRGVRDPDVIGFNQELVARAMLKSLDEIAGAEKIKPEIKIKVKTKPKVETKVETKGKPKTEVEVKPTGHKPTEAEVSHVVKQIKDSEFVKEMPLDSPSLGNYKNELLPTVEVMKRLKEYGVVDKIDEILKTYPRSNNAIVKGARAESVARQMLKKLDEISGKAQKDYPKLTKKAEVEAAKPKSVEDNIINDPVILLPPGLKERVIRTAEDMRDELESAFVKRTGAFGEGRIGSTTHNTFPEWYRRIRRTKKEILAELNKIIDDRVIENTKFAQNLKSEIIDRLLGEHQQSEISGSSGKFQTIVWGNVDKDPIFEGFLKETKGKLTKAELFDKWNKYESLTKERGGENVSAEGLNPAELKQIKPITGEIPEAPTGEGLKPVGKKAEIKEPKKIEEVLSGYEPYSVKKIVKETDMNPKYVATHIKELLSRKLIEPVKSKSGERLYKSTDEFRTVLNDMKTNPSKYDANLKQLNANPIPQVIRGLNRATYILDDLFEKYVGRKIYKTLSKGLGKIVPETIKEQIITNYGLPEYYLRLRQAAKDAIQRYNETAKELGDILTYKNKGEKFTVAERKRLAQMIRGSTSNDPVLRARADKAITEIKQLEKLGKELEVLPVETYNTKLPRRRIAQLLEENAGYRAELADPEITKIRKDKLESLIAANDKKVKNSFKLGGQGYFKRVYLSKEQTKLFNKYGYYKPTRLDLTSAIGRKDIPFEVRKKMGEVLTAAYPVSKGIVLEGKDVSLGNFFKAISENPDYISATEREGFVQMDKNPKLGKLSGQFVEKRIAADINDVVKLTSPEYMDGVLRQINSVWKAAHTIMSPNTHGRNVLNNSIMLDYSGVSHLDQARLLPKAIQAIRGKGEWAADFKASRLNDNTFLRQELDKYLDVVAEKNSWFDLSVQEKFVKAYGKITGVDTKLGKMLGDAYQMEETVFKAIKFISERENGKSVLDARMEAQKWLFDYSDIPKVINYLRTNPIFGKPFVTWSYKAFPRVIETAITRPITFWKYPVIFSALTKYAVSKLGMTEKEWQDIKKDFSKHLAKGEWLLLPFRDNNNNMQMFDLTYIMPYKDIWDLWQGMYNLGRTGEFIKNENLVTTMVNMVDAPVTTAIRELGANKNTYSGQPIWNEVDEPGEKWAATADYFYKLFMPNLAPELPFGISKGGYSYHKLASAIMQNDDYYGRNFTVAPALASSILGLKTIPIQPEKNRRRKYYRLQNKLIEFSKKKNRIDRDNTISDEEKSLKINDIERKIEKIKDEQQRLGVK